MYCKIKIMIIIVSLFAVGLFINVDAEAAEKTIGSFCYTYDELTQNSIWITKIDIIKEKNIQTLRVPSKIDGKKVVKIGRKEDKRDKFGDVADSDNIFGISLNEDSNQLEPENILKKTAKIKNIILPETLTDMTPNCFLRVQDGKSITIPKGLTKNVLYLGRMVRWRKFVISTQNKKYKVKNGMILSKGGKKTYGFVGPGNQAVIPKGVKTLGERTFYGAKVTSIRIPKSVNKIERDVFSYLKSVHIQIDRANKNYGVASGCLYSKRSGRLVLGIAKEGVVKIPPKVTCVNDKTVFCGKNISEIIFPKTMKTLGYGWSNSFIIENIQGDTLELIFKGKVPPMPEKGVVFLFPSISCVKITVPQKKKAVYQLAFWDATRSPAMEGTDVTIQER